MPTPHTPASLFAYLDELGIGHQTVHHPPVFTVEEAKLHRADDEAGAHIKNLFLRNKKGAMWLVVALEDRKIDLKTLGVDIGAGKVSFASPERLMTHLGVVPGAVTPFAVINDHERVVSVVIDACVSEHDQVHAHPLSNDMTTVVATADLMKFLAACGHAPQRLTF